MLIKVKGNLRERYESYKYSTYHQKELHTVSGSIVKGNISMIASDRDVEIQDVAYTCVDFISGYLPSSEVMEVYNPNEDYDIIDGSVLVDEEDGNTWVGDLSLIPILHTDSVVEDEDLKKEIIRREGVIKAYQKEAKVVEHERGLIDGDWVEGYLMALPKKYNDMSELERYSHCKLLKHMGILTRFDDFFSTHLLIERLYNIKGIFMLPENLPLERYNIVRDYRGVRIPHDRLLKPYRKQKTKTKGKGFGR